MASSPWLTTHPIDYRLPLTRSTTTDVCVVGAGIAGLTTAYLLAREGRSVLVLEGRGMGEGMTARSTAHVTLMLDKGFAYVERIHGVAGARMAADSHRQAIETIGRIVAREGVECDFSYLDGYLFPGRGHDGRELLAEAEAAHRAKVEVELHQTLPLPHFHAGPVLRFPYQAQFNAMAYLGGLLRACLQSGVRVHTDTYVRRLEEHKRCVVRTQRGEFVGATSVVVATNIPFHVPINLHLKQTAIMTFVVGALVPRGSVPSILMADLEVPHHYVRVAPFDIRHDLLLVGGEDRRTGQQAEDDVLRYERLREWTRQRFPMCVDFPYRWCGQILETSDGLAYIGRNTLSASNVYLATGDCGLGMTHGTIAGVLITDLLMGRENPWTALYNPLRVRLRALPTMLREDMEMARAYARWAEPADTESAADIPAGQGRILHQDDRKVAAYRDHRGELHLLSPACPHLGGMVTWNDADKTWDCACHGSRFDCMGRLMSGPARQDLPLLERIALT